MAGGVQVVAIGNAFELVHQRIVSYDCLSELERVDERHFGQKSTFWSTRYGFPAVVLCTMQPTPPVLDDVFGYRSRPLFVEPVRASSSVCRDLLTDIHARKALISSLDPDKEVFLAPYVHTEQVERVAEFLLRECFRLVDFLPQAQLVRALCDKAVAEELVFQPVKTLRAHRPRTLAAQSDDHLGEVLRRFASSGTERVVVKSNSAVGGSGVFFVNPADIVRVKHPSELLVGRGQNHATRSGRYLVEEYIPSDASPTVDIDIDSGSVHLVGVALQRLFDGRYYSGFYTSSRLKTRWWFAGVTNLALTVGARLAELGYRGPANVDFVVSAISRRITLIEINPRRSALIDGFSVLKLKPEPLGPSSVSVADYVNVKETIPSLTEACAACALSASDSEIVFPVADGGFDTPFRWVSLWAASFDGGDSEAILQEVVRLVQDPRRQEVGIIRQHARLFA